VLYHGLLVTVYTYDSHLWGERTSSLTPRP
jgi:hypothetical protein